MKQAEFIQGINTFFQGEYAITPGRVVPDVDDIAFGKEGTEIELAMMFIDIRESTRIVDGLRRVTAARMYKAFLWGVARLARLNEGELRSFNGDGVLIAFAGAYKCTHAAKAALQMAWFAHNLLRPELEVMFQRNSDLRGVEFGFGIGIDVGRVLVVRGGIRGENNNDLVWVGNATNYAVKLSGLVDEGYNVFISAAVYKKMAASSKVGGDPPQAMWEKRVWSKMDNMQLYRSNWTWPLG